jgi:Uma2 family endonuclease
MGMPAATDQRYWTPDDVWALPDDGNRYECIDGQLLVTPAPTFSHQRVALAFAKRLDSWAAPHGVGQTLIAPADVRLTPEALVQPDVFVTRPRADGSLPTEKDRDLRLHLAIEILSPSTARTDRTVKRVFYVNAGVEYWIVDPTARLVERWRPDDARPEILTEMLTWQPSGTDEQFVIDLNALFSEALGE